MPRPAKKTLHLLLSPEQLESKLPASGTTACTCQFALDKQRNRTLTNSQACGFTHTFSNLFLEKDEKNERDQQRNETRIKCALTETLTIFLKVMKHFLSMCMSLCIWNLSSFFVRSIDSGYWQIWGHEEEVEIDGSAKGYVCNCCVIGWTKDRTLVWLVQQRSQRRDFGLESKWGKCNYCKWSQRFCWSGWLPDFSISEILTIRKSRITTCAPSL